MYELLKRHQLLWTICVSYLALGGIYLVATPLFEASDELWHMGMVNHLADHHALPVQDPNLPTDYEQEGSQPPLYYWLSAQLVRALDRSDFHAVTQPNPHVMAGIPLATHNKNLVLHPERPPRAQREYIGRIHPAWGEFVVRTGDISRHVPKRKTRSAKRKVGSDSDSVGGV